MRDGKRRRRLVRCCADGVWWRGERSISVSGRGLPQAGLQGCSAHATLQKAKACTQHSPNVLIARIAAALGLAALRLGAAINLATIRH